MLELNTSLRKEWELVHNRIKYAILSNHRIVNLRSKIILIEIILLFKTIFKIINFKTHPRTTTKHKNTSSNIILSFNLSNILRFFQITLYLIYLSNNHFTLINYLTILIIRPTMKIAKRMPHNYTENPDRQACDAFLYYILFLAWQRLSV